MKNFKSFDEFLNEGYGSSTGSKGQMPINEALFSFLTPDQKFKIDSDRPNAAIGEIAAFHFVIKMETEDDNAARQTAANQIAQNPDIQKLIAAGGVFFLDITKDRERKLTGQHIFKGVLSVRDSKTNDVSNLKPILTSTDGKLKLYNMAEAGQKSASAEDVTIGSSGTSGSAGSAGSSGTSGDYPWDWTKTTPNDEILKYLTEKLLAFEPIQIGRAHV